jgi:hypothetical protein
MEQISYLNIGLPLDVAQPLQASSQLKDPDELSSGKRQQGFECSAYATAFDIFRRVYPIVTPYLEHSRRLPTDPLYPAPEQSHARDLS